MYAPSKGGPITPGAPGCSQPVALAAEPDVTPPPASLALLLLVPCLSNGFSSLMSTAMRSPVPAPLLQSYWSRHSCSSSFCSCFGFQQTGLFARPGGTPGGVGGQNYGNAAGDLTKMLVRDQTIRSHKLSLDNSQPQTFSVKRSRAQGNQSRFTSLCSSVFADSR